jgi:hypothetical protein
MDRQEMASASSLNDRSMVTMEHAISISSSSHDNFKMLQVHSFDGVMNPGIVSTLLWDM